MSSFDLYFRQDCKALSDQQTSNLFQFTIKWPPCQKRRLKKGVAVNVTPLRQGYFLRQRAIKHALIFACNKHHMYCISHRSFSSQSSSVASNETVLLILMVTAFQQTAQEENRESQHDTINTVELCAEKHAKETGKRIALLYRVWLAC